MAAAASTNLGNGFPAPGPQDPTGQQVMDHIFFLSEAGWKAAREEGKYDIIVIGTGFCGLGLVHQALENNPSVKILMLERGSFFLPEHFQNLPSATSKTIGGMAETFPWTLDARTATGVDGTVRWQHGMLNFFGGRSTTWSAWCPRPNDQELLGWPKTMKKAIKKNIEPAEKLLNVQDADKIDEGRSGEIMNEIHKTVHRPVYRALQNAVQKRLKEGLEEGGLSASGIYRSEPAPLASRSDTGIDYQKFSTTGPLLDLLLEYENLHIATNVTVQRILRQGQRATALETSRGVLPLSEAKLVLAMGTLPPTTLVRNSFPELENIGNRFSSHFITAVVARVPKTALESKDDKFGPLEVGAMYVAGVAHEDKDEAYYHQYHVQLTALYNEDPQVNFDKSMRYMPDVVATASPEQLRTSIGYVVFVCAVLGELDFRTETNQFLRNQDDPNITTNSLLRIVSNGASDEATWNGMDKATFAALEWLASATEAGDNLEYWRDGRGWTKERPTLQERRVDALVHESSTLHAGDETDPSAPVDAETYKVKGTDNVYVTGGGLWPQGGSWNPTLAMTALAMDLAMNLVPPCKDRVNGIDISGIVAALDPADNVYLILKDVQSHYLWVNENFANLVGVPADKLIGTLDTHRQKVEDDVKVLKTGIPQLNYEESITVPDSNGGTRVIRIRTQKGLIRNPSNPNEFQGITVCFSLLDTA